MEKLAIVDKTLFPSILFSKSSLYRLAVGLVIFVLEILEEMHFVATKSYHTYSIQSLTFLKSIIIQSVILNFEETEKYVHKLNETFLTLTQPLSS